MILIFIYSFLTIFILFLLGFGLTLLFTPKQLQSLAFWLTPWFTVVFLIFFLTIFSLAGLSVKQISPFLIGFLLFLNFYAFWKKKLRYSFCLKEDILIGLFITVSIVFNLSPLIRNEKMLTTISMGNNDVIIYAQTPEYLVNHSIIEYFQTKIINLKPTDEVTGNLLYYGFRWGTPLLSSFFLNILQLKGYQYAYLLQTILFGLTLPLTYTLFKVLYKPKILGLILSGFLFIFNSNLLYMLYHNFFGQVFFWGIELFLLIFLFTYYSSSEPFEKTFTKFDYIIGLTLTILYFAYHEAVILTIPPLILFTILYSLFKRNIKLILPSIRIFIVVVIAASISISNSFVVDFLQASKIDEPVGWTLFRTKISYANPFEAMGFYSIHSMEPMNLILAFVLSLITLIIIIKGFFTIRYKMMALSFITIFSLFFIWSTILHHNFFAYNRVLTYTLPFFIIIFSVGLLELLSKNRKLLIGILAILLSLEIIFAVKLNRRFNKEHISVDKSLISLSEIRNLKYLKELIYTDQALIGLVSYWRQIWTDYFLFPLSVYSPHNFDKIKKTIPDNSLILLPKVSILYNSPKILLNNIVWENAYYRLGRLCNSSSCLLSRPEDLSNIYLGNSEYEDSLLITGWSGRETTNRWATGKESTLRLVTKDSGFNKFTFEAQTLKEPQTVTVFLDGKLLGTKSISTQWAQYTFLIPEGIERGVHQIRLTYSNTYKPSEVLNSQDTRDLAVNFRKIWLQ